MRRIAATLIIAGLGVALLVSIVLATGLGPTSIAPRLTSRIVLAHLSNGSGGWSTSTDTIVWLIRLPRVLLAGIVGASLAMVGVALQAVTANRLADQPVCPGFDVEDAAQVAQVVIDIVE